MLVTPSSCIFVREIIYETPSSALFNPQVDMTSYGRHSRRRYFSWWFAYFELVREAIRSDDICKLQGLWATKVTQRSRVLETLVIAHLVKKFPHFMEPEGLLPC